MQLTVQEMKEIVEREVLNYIVKFEDHYVGLTKFPIDIPEIEFKIKGTTAGRAGLNFYNGTGSVDYNVDLMKDNFDEFMDSTVPHEVAHYCCMILYGQLRRGSKNDYHGSKWKGLMRFFGADPERCHSYDVSKVKRTRTIRRWEYACGCNTEHQLSTVRHNKIQRGYKSYICKHCRETIKWTGYSAGHKNK